MGYADVVLQDSPVAYWPLHSRGAIDLSDRSGNGRTLTQHDGSSAGSISTEVAAPDFPRLDSVSVKFPAGGGTAYPTVAEYAYFSYTPPSWTAPFSVEFWAKRSVFNVGRNILGSRWYSANFGLGLGIEPDGSMYCDIGNGSAWLANGPEGTTGVLIGARWNHVILSVSTTGFTWYVNGVAAGNRTVTLTGALLGNATHTITVGWHGWVTDVAFDGDLSDVALYTTALTATQALAHYQAGLRGAVIL